VSGRPHSHLRSQSERGAHHDGASAVGWSKSEIARMRVATARRLSRSTWPATFRHGRRHRSCLEPTALISRPGSSMTRTSASTLGGAAQGGHLVLAGPVHLARRSRLPTDALVGLVTVPGRRHRHGRRPGLPIPTRGRIPGRMDAVRELCAQTGSSALHRARLEEPRLEARETCNQVKVRYWQILDDASLRGEANAGLLALAADCERSDPAAARPPLTRIHTASPTSPAPAAR
jgi:hypothetical protein